MRRKTKREILKDVILNSSFDGTIPENFIENVLGKIEAFQENQLPFAVSAPFIYNVTKNKFIYISESIYNITGLSLEYIHSVDVLEFINRLVTEEHALPISYFASKAYQSFNHKVDSDNPTINIDYNIKHQANNKIIRFLAQYRPILWNNKKQPIVQLGCFYDISHFSKFGAPRLTIIKDNKIIYSEQSEIGIQHLKNELDLTKKELELLNLISKGLESSQIAQKLSTSISTVYTHRKNIKEKTGKQLPELIKILHERGLL